MLTPAGRFPPVGDSEERTLSWKATESKALRFSASGGRKGSAPASEETDAVFPEAGEAILRDRRGRNAEDQAGRFYVHLHAAQHLPMGHRHQDDLSSIVHYQQRWWLVEGGKYGYRRDSVRSHVQSAFAHNGPILQGRILGPLDHSGLDTWIDPRSSHTSEAAAVRAVSERFARRPGAPSARAERIHLLLRHPPAWSSSTA